MIELHSYHRRQILEPLAHLLCWALLLCFTQDSSALADFSGSAHDAYIMHSSSIPTLMMSLRQDRARLLGDSVYPLKPWLLIPIAHLYSAAEESYNASHVCTRSIIKHTFGLLKSYLAKLLQNHTVYACDGDHLNLQCPRHSTISIQSAFYGHRPQSYDICSTQQLEAMEKASVECLAKTTLQKVLDECQDVRACQLLVNSRVFGPDPCPGTTKYLLVSFKCRPTEYKTRSVCENKELKLHCIESRFLNIYSAVYGRLSHEKSNCSSSADRDPQFDCLSHAALEVLSRNCYGKQRCKITVNDHHFGSPCLPGVKKYLTVNYACVPKIILTAVDPKISIPSPTSKQNEVKINLNPRESRIPVNDGIIFSNFLATFAYIRDHPERAALLFMSSVCLGLVLTLCLLVVRVSCTADFQKHNRMKHPLPKESSHEEDSSEEDEDEEDSTPSDSSDELVGLCKTSHFVHFSMDAADLAERIDRREQILQEIWMNSGLDMSSARHLNMYY